MHALLDYTPTTAYGTTTLLGREQDCLNDLRERFKEAMEYEGAYRTEAVKALEFLHGRQWEPQTQRQREAAGRPCLTINTAGQYERQILNELRMRRPSLKARPVGNGADVETAHVLQGLLRHIEVRSHADQAYDTAAEAAVRHGRGYFRLLIDYVDPMSFQQELLIRRIRNPFMVYMDPSAQLPTYADARWGLLFEMVPKKVHQAEYGISGDTMAAWTSVGDTWISTEEVRVAEYFFKDPTRYTLARLADNTTVLLEPMIEGFLLEHAKDLVEPDVVQEAITQLFTVPRGRHPLQALRQNVHQLWQSLDALGQELTAWFIPQVQDLFTHLIDVRQTSLDRVWHCKTNGHMILEEGIWPGKHIPIIPVLGNELDINGKVHLSGYLHTAMDPMRMKNYWNTMQAEHIALSPVPPWLVEEGQIGPYTEVWRTANTVPRAYLPYKNVDVRGRSLPPPQRQAFEPPIAAITAAMSGTERDIEAAIGIYRSNLGSRSNETSGKAILARDQQADTGTYHYGDNLRRAIEFGGEQLIDLIPKIPSYTHDVILRILGDDGSPQMVRAQPGVRSHTVPEGDESGIAGVYDLTTGQYDVVVDVGPSYQTKREEALESLVQVGQMAPQVAEIGADLIVGNIDAQGMDELAQRLKKLLPPELLEDGAQGDPKEQVIQLQAQMQQLTAQLEQLNAFAQSCEQQLQALGQENQALKQGHELKMAQLALEREKFAAEMEIKRAELRQADYKLDLEALKIDQARELKDRQQPAEE